LKATAALEEEVEGEKQLEEIVRRGRVLPVLHWQHKFEGICCVDCVMEMEGTSRE
jgi:hypothetical protein